MKLVPSAGFIPTSFRTLPRFNVVRARTVDEAVSAFGDAVRPAVLAGGTDLPARFNEGFAPSDLIDISRIEALKQIVLRDGAIEIGATVTHANGCRHSLIVEHLPTFSAAWRRIANVRIRMSATIGGNLMARRTRYEGAILLSALGARLRFASRQGETEWSVADIWSGAIQSDALLTTIVVPLHKGLAFHYARDLRPLVTQAVCRNAAGTGVVVTATEHTVPCVRPLLADGSARGELTLSDPVASSAYLRKVSAALLGRQLAAMGAT